MNQLLYQVLIDSWGVGDGGSGAQHELDVVRDVYKRKMDRDGKPYGDVMSQVRTGGADVRSDGKPFGHAVSTGAHLAPRYQPAPHLPRTSTRMHPPYRAQPRFSPIAHCPALLLTYRPLPHTWRRPRSPLRRSMAGAPRFSCQHPAPHPSRWRAAHLPPAVPPTRRHLASSRDAAG